MIVFAVSTWVLLLVMLALAATVPPMPHKALLRNVGIAWFISMLAWSTAGSTDCGTACTVWHDGLNGLIVGIPLLGLLAYLALVTRDWLRRRSSRVSH